ncbi:SH3 and multiple ankyrin repeat domains protein 1-like [Choloepus didactylus]|uniref:SH3 and multiple ankyrin repeat domains protein 1-like n=1 Tax=Choloepus didactylus TaxID=27675 RepID=UPI00189FE137|nr:SH3 and multiple ankyrin repeat domains protein 1-like [Choloepus didactylus]
MRGSLRGPPPEGLLLQSPSSHLTGPAWTLRLRRGRSLPGSPGRQPPSGCRGQESSHASASALGRGNQRSGGKSARWQLRRSQPKGAGLAAGRPRCAAGTSGGAAAGPERVTWHAGWGLDRRGAYRPGLPGARERARPGHASPRMHSAVYTLARKPPAPHSPPPQEPDRLGSMPPPSCVI